MNVDLSDLKVTQMAFTFITGIISLCMHSTFQSLSKNMFVNLLSCECLFCRSYGLIEFNWFVILQAFTVVISSVLYVV